MTLEELAKKYNIKESTIKKNFSRTQETIIKKYGIKIIKEGRGDKAIYTEEIIQMDEITTALTMYQADKNNVILEQEMFSMLLDWHFIVVLAILTTPLLVFRGNYKQFLEYVKMDSGIHNINKLKEVL